MMCFISVSLAIILQAGIDFTFPPKEKGAIRARLQYRRGRCETQQMILTTISGYQHLRQAFHSRHPLATDESVGL